MRVCFLCLLASSLRFVCKVGVKLLKDEQRQLMCSFTTNSLRGREINEQLALGVIDINKDGNCYLEGRNGETDGCFLRQKIMTRDFNDC